jgi:hypothetical protein
VGFFDRRTRSDQKQMSMSVGGVGSPAWPDKDWPTSSADPVVQRVDSIQKSVDDERSLGALATGTARRTSSTSGLTQQDFEVAARVGPNGVTAKVEGVVAPKPDRNPWNAGADRTPVNPYDHIVDALRTSALKRDAALAGTSATASSTDAAADSAVATSPAKASATTDTAKLAYAPMSSSQYGEAYVRDAIDAYQRNSGLSSGSSTSTAVALADSGTDAAADPALASTDAPTPAPPDPQHEHEEAFEAVA